MKAIFGPEGERIASSGDPTADKNDRARFTELAQKKMDVVTDPKKLHRGTLVVGDDNWTFPVPLVENGGKWYFASKEGMREILFRRIGHNELDVIQICLGYVEAQKEYAAVQHDGSGVNQYAQRILSTAGKQDGLAWQNPDGSWSGPIGEKIARAIEQGYSGKAEPYHGYFFKILKGQGPAAPLGEMNYVIKGTMIGGFALVAAPAEYGETGMKSFIVSQDGVVYQKDAGPASLNDFIRMERFNPDQTWTPVSDD